MEQIPMDISLYILRFMITVPDLIWKSSFVQKPWMILQRLMALKDPEELDHKHQP